MTSQAEKRRIALLSAVIEETYDDTLDIKMEGERRNFVPHKLIKEWRRQKKIEKRARELELLKKKYGEFVDEVFAKDLAYALHVDEDLAYKVCSIITREMANALARHERVSMGSMGWLVPRSPSLLRNPWRDRYGRTYPVWFEYSADFDDAINEFHDLDLGEVKNRPPEVSNHRPPRLR